jgi:putative cell wall-binding protein
VSKLRLAYLLLFTLVVVLVLGTGGVASAAVKTASAGWGHVLVVKTDGSAWAWGYNEDGELGRGDIDDRWYATQVNNDANWESVGAGVNHSMAIKTNKTLWSWGGNQYGQLGLGDTDSRLEPTQVGTFDDWLTVSSFTYHSVAIRADESLWAWGSNSTGQMGTGDTDDYLEPIDVWLPETRRFQDFTGTDRYQTAIMISKQAFPAGADYVIVCKGDNFPDALAAAPLAAARNAPVIIRPSTGATTPVLNELQRLKPKFVYFIGLPPAVKNEIRALPW